MIFRAPASHAVPHALRVQPQQLRIGAPQAGRLADRHEGVDAAPAAQVRAAAAAGRTQAAGEDVLHRHAIAHLHAPAPRRALADGLDHPDGLVAQDRRQRGRDQTLELLDVGAADAAGLDAQQRSVVAGLRHGQLARLEAPRRGQDHGEGLAGRHRPDLPSLAFGSLRVA
jgi:hypothetical protein